MAVWGEHTQVPNLGEALSHIETQAVEPQASLDAAAPMPSNKQGLIFGLGFVTGVCTTLIGYSWSPSFVNRKSNPSGIQKSQLTLNRIDVSTLLVMV